VNPLIVALSASPRTEPGPGGSLTVCAVAAPGAGPPSANADAGIAPSTAVIVAITRVRLISPLSWNRSWNQGVWISADHGQTIAGAGAARVGARFSDRIGGVLSIDRKSNRR
jgi:hypothetical protein